MVIPEGEMAKKFTESILKDKTVVLNVSGGRDRFGHLICVVFLADTRGQPLYPSFNKMLLDSGYGTLNATKLNLTNWDEDVVAFR
jgi:endonuclease YncB( thermonuclease family)